MLPDFAPGLGARTGTMPEMIRLEDLRKSFDGGETFVVDGVTLEIQAGEVFMLLGTSGCGKSTTLKMINRLVEPTSGSIEVGGSCVMEQDPVELRRRIGYVIQKIGLMPHMTILENVALVPQLQGTPRGEREARARELLETVHLDPEAFGGRYPDELSGGQQQRVGVARALAADPEVLLMDEPFGALDALTRDALQKEVLDLKDRLGKTVVFVTHDLFEALALGDRVAVMDRGRVEQVGAPRELLANPATPFVKQLFEKPREQLAVLESLEG